MRKNIFLEKFRKQLGLDRPQLIVFCLIVFIVVWFVGNSAYNFVNHSLVRTYVIESEYERRSVLGYGFLKSESSLIGANELGSIKKIKQDGARVAKNHAVFSITNEKAGAKKEFYAPISGILSYKVDGYETLKTAQDIAGLDFKKIYEAERKLSPAEAVTEKGEKVAKVVDNLKPVHLYMTIEKKKRPVFEKIGDIVRVDFSDISESTRAELTAIKENPDKNGYFCEFELLSSSDKLLKHRILATEVYILKDAVLEISKATIVPVNDTLGVYILNDGIVAWRPLEIIKHEGDKYFAKSLPEKTEIILNPDRVDAGDIL